MNKITLYFMFVLFFTIIVFASWQENSNLDFEAGNDTYWNFGWVSAGQNYNSIVTEQWSSEGNYSLFVAGANNGLGIWKYHKTWATHELEHLNKGDMICIDVKKNYSSYPYWEIYLETGGLLMDQVYSGEYYDVCSNSESNGNLSIIVQGKLSSCSSQCLAKIYIDNVRVYRCNDSIRNGDETDIDCGGRCNLCEIGKKCNSNSDCESHYCNNSKICVEPPYYSYYYNYNFEMGKPVYWNFGWTGGGQNYNSVVTDRWSSEGNYSLFIAGAYDKLGIWKYHKAWAVHNNTQLEKGDTVCIDLKKNSTSYSSWKVYLYTNGTFLETVSSGEYNHLCTNSTGSGDLGIVVQGTASECNIGGCYARFFVDNISINIDNCSDGKLNRFETDVDCGGFCKKCLDGQFCNYSFDCESNYCDNGICFDDRCHNKILDPGEEGIDCGGFCSDQCDCKNVTLNIVTSTNGLNVKINNIYEGQTDYLYFLQKEILSVNCQNSYLVEIYCDDNMTLCNSETVYLPSNGETATVVDNDCVKTCSNDKNIWITNKDVVIKNNVINLSYHSADFSGSVDIKLQKISRSTGLIDGEYTISSSIATKSTKKEIYSGFDLSDASGLNIYLEATDDDKEDNFVYRIISKDTPKTYLSINTLYPEVDSLIRTYLEQYVDSVSENEAELVISVGKFTDEFESVNAESLTFIPRYGMYGWGLKGNHIYAYRKIETAPYASLIGRLSYNQPKPTITVFGNSRISAIAGVKKLISAKSLFFSDLKTEIEPLVLGTYDKTALGTFDLLKSYRTNLSSPAALKAIDKFLFDNIYDISIRPVKTLDQTSYQEETILRVKNVNSDYSKEFREAISETDKPVVFAGGIFSDLESFESYKDKGDIKKGFAVKLAEEGRDVWEIEITGGPTIDSDCENYNCPDYTYDDLVDYYWPALISGVLEYSGKYDITYIGHSNGCRVALNSLDKYQSSGKPNAGYYFNYSDGEYISSSLPQQSVTNFIGLACPGAFDGMSFFKEFFLKYGDSILEENPPEHFDNKYLGSRLQSKCENDNKLDERNRTICLYLARVLGEDEGSEISLNFSKYYLDVLKSETDSQPVSSGLHIDNFKLFYSVINWMSEFEIGEYPHYEDHDGLTTADDNIEIASIVSSYTSDKTKDYTNKGHSDIPNDNRVYKDVLEVIKND